MCSCQGHSPFHKFFSSLNRNPATLLWIFTTKAHETQRFYNLSIICKPHQVQMMCWQWVIEEIQSSTPMDHQAPSRGPSRDGWKRSAQVASFCLSITLKIISYLPACRLAAYFSERAKDLELETTKSFFGWCARWHICLEASPHPDNLNTMMSCQ